MMTLKLIALLLASIDVQVDLLEGEPVTGSLTAITSDEMTLTIDGQPKSTPLSNVITVTNRQSSRPSEDDQGQLILDDGSTIAGRLQSINAKEVISSATFEDQLTIPRPAVRAIRLSPENPEWAEEWSAFLERENDDDLLILKKRDGSGLDF